MILGVGDREDLYSVWITLLPLSLGKTNASLNRRFVARIYQFCFSVPNSSFVLFFTVKTILWPKKCNQYKKVCSKREISPCPLNSLPRGQLVTCFLSFQSNFMCTHANIFFLFFMFHRL